MTLSGFICVRNAFDLDYCFTESIRSLLDVCNEVCVCDSDSTDDTKRYLDQWARQEPKLTLANFPWTDPKGDPAWYVGWLSYARDHLKTKGGFAITLDADEILHEHSYDLVRYAANNELVLTCHRYNFWGDASHLIPHGECCGHAVIRVGPQKLCFPSDYPDPRCEEMMRLAKPSNVQIMHYGFLRERSAFFRKARAVQRIWANSYDKRLDDADKAGGNWMANPNVVPWTKDLLPFTGSHPAVIIPWLQKRGWL